MAENDTKECPYCAESVRVQASICPYCRSPLAGVATSDAYREHPGRQIGGVCIGIAEAFGVSVTFVRLAFIVLTFISFIGPPLYVTLWVLIPAQPGGQSPLGRVINGDGTAPSVLERTVAAIEQLLDRVAAWLRGQSTPPKAPETSDGPAEGTS